jgi:hypothetical protein
MTNQLVADHVAPLQASAVALHRSPPAFLVDTNEAAIAVQIVGNRERYRRVRFFLDALTE